MPTNEPSKYVPLNQSNNREEGYAAVQVPDGIPVQNQWFILPKLPPRYVLIFFIWFYPFQVLVATLFGIKEINFLLTGRDVIYDTIGFDGSILTKENINIFLMILVAVYAVIVGGIVTFIYSKKVLQPAVATTGFHINVVTLNLLTFGKRYSKRKNSTYYFKSFGADVSDDGRKMCLLISQDRKHAIIMDEWNADKEIERTKR